MSNVLILVTPLSVPFRSFLLLFTLHFAPEMELWEFWVGLLLIVVWPGFFFFRPLPVLDRLPFPTTGAILNTQISKILAAVFYTWRASCWTIIEAPDFIYSLIHSFKFSAIRSSRPAPHLHEKKRGHQHRRTQTTVRRWQRKIKRKADNRGGG